MLKDGRTMVYGAMGGDGQPQSQSAVFTRIVNFGMDPQAAVNAPRWLLGRTWGETSETLKLEARFEMGLAHALMEWGHEVEISSRTTRRSGTPARSCAIQRRARRRRGPAERRRRRGLLGRRPSHALGRNNTKTLPLTPP